MTLARVVGGSASLPTRAATKVAKALGLSTPKRINPKSLANLRPAWKPGESGNPAGRPRKEPMVEPLLRHYASLTYAELDFLRKHLDELTLVEVMVLQGYLAAMDQQGDKARDWVTKKLDGDDDKRSGDTINIHGGQTVITTWPGAQAE